MRARINIYNWNWHSCRICYLIHENANHCSSTMTSRHRRIVQYNHKTSNEWKQYQLHKDFEIDENSQFIIGYSRKFSMQMWQYCGIWNNWFIYAFPSFCLEREWLAFHLNKMMSLTKVRTHLLPALSSQYLSDKVYLRYFWYLIDLLCGFWITDIQKVDNSSRRSEAILKLVYNCVTFDAHSALKIGQRTECQLKFFKTF